MNSRITVSMYPLSTVEKLNRFSHPQRQLHYGKKTLLESNKVLSESIIRSSDEIQKHRVQSQLLQTGILSQWSDKPFVHKMLKRSFSWLEKTHPLTSLRSDGTPRIFHFLEPASRLSFLHADADAILATLHHDDFEDDFSNPRQLYKILCAQNPDHQTQTLAKAVIWQIHALSNPYKTNLKKEKMSSPSDWKNKKVYSYMLGRMLAEDKYLRDINSLELADPLVIKVTGDRLHNVQSNLDPKLSLDKKVYSYLKAFRSLNWAKKIHYATQYYTLDAIEQGLSQISATFEDARAQFSIPFGTDVSIPIDLYSTLHYHKNAKSFEQGVHDSTLVELAGVRSELSSDTLRKLPYSGTAVAVLFCPTKSYFHRLDSHPIEVQLPRRIGFGDPSSGKGWHQLRADILKNELQEVLEKNNLKSFEVKTMPTLLPGKMGMDSAMFRLEYVGGSLVKYLRSFADPLSKYNSLVFSIRDVLYDFVDLKFHRISLPEESTSPPPESINEIFRRLGLSK